MKKRILLAPGPTPVSSRTLLAMAQPLIHHRSVEFQAIVKEVREKIKKVFQTDNDVVIFSSTGTGAMESAVANLLSLNDKAIVVRAGKFGERWSFIIEAYGCQAINLDIPWGRSIDPNDVERLLIEDPSIKAVFVQALETSTGVDHPIQELSYIVNKTKAVLVVDAISALGAYSIPTDYWGINVVISGSQKALMLPPGLAFVSIDYKAKKFMEVSTLPKFYFSWYKELKNQNKNKGAFTSPITLFIGLLDVLRYVIDEVGIENIYKQTALNSKGFKAAVNAWGLNLFSKERSSSALSAVQCPDGINSQELIRLLKEKYGIYIAGGQDRLKGKIFRVAHMGYINEFDTLQVISAIEIVLKEIGYIFKMGSGVSAAQNVFGGLDDEDTYL